MSSDPAPPPAAAAAYRTFRLPKLTYLVVVFLFFCVVPLSFTDRAGQEAPPPVLGPQTLLLLIPVLAAVFIARTSTRVSAEGITVRAVFGRRSLRWTDIRGLSIDERSVYAVCADGAVRLPCVRVSDLAGLSAASGGRLPEVPAARQRFAPSRRRR